MTKAEEDYIKLLYQPTNADQEGMKISTIAKHFGYTEQSVNEMIKRLSDKQLLEYIPYRAIHLTSKGRELALKMIRAHRVWEVFLYEKLGYRWDEVHKLSEVLEHTDRDEMVERLYQFLQKPSVCPHGNPIPKLNKDYLIDAYEPLHLIGKNQSFIVKRVEDSPTLLKFLTSISIQLETKLTITDVDTFNELMHISVEKKRCSIAFKHACKIFGTRN